jgi:hypothetical protein
MKRKDLIEEVTNAIVNAVSNDTTDLTEDEIKIATYAAYEYLKTVNPNLPNRPH